MSHFHRLSYFAQPRETFSQGHGQTNGEDRTWEDVTGRPLAHDKVVRSTHGVNCTGSCSWKIYAQGRHRHLETQQTDYLRTRPDLPNHRAVMLAVRRGASWAGKLKIPYSANRA